MMADFKKIVLIFLFLFLSKLRLLLKRCTKLPLTSFPWISEKRKSPHLFYAFPLMYLGRWRWIKVCFTHFAVKHSCVQSHVCFSQIDQQMYLNHSISWAILSWVYNCTAVMRYIQSAKCSPWWEHFFIKVKFGLELVLISVCYSYKVEVTLL